uniref:Patatin n=1 Tax=uncultured Chloroflexota bacterium TaxID=166587 RepID=H5SK83_9CHLR|nr:patatin [uncultured bacterium]BAL56569.1 patatin [uncultured Chloroflexota bacterium]
MNLRQFFAPARGIALALGGGGARGNAHIGVLRVLEAEGFRVRAVAGTSAGGLVAVFYAAGFTPDEIERLFSQANQEDLYGRSPTEGPSLLGLAGAERWLRKHLGNRTFAELRLPCAVTAVDLNQRREVILDEGDVVSALLATIAVPGIFPPRQLNGMLLVDGGVLDPVPVNVARALAPGLPVVAVALTPDLDAPIHPALPLNLPPLLSEPLRRLRITQAMSIFLDSVEIGGRALAHWRLAVEKPEVLIRPKVSQIGLLEKVNVPEVVQLGEEAARQALPELRRMQKPFWQRLLKFEG